MSSIIILNKFLLHHKLNVRQWQIYWPTKSWVFMKTILCSIFCDFMDSFNVFKGPTKKVWKKWFGSGLTRCAFFLYNFLLRHMPTLQCTGHQWNFMWFFILTLEQITVLKKYRSYNKPIPKISHQNSTELV